MFSFRKDKRSFTKKLMNDIQNREKEESEIITIGKITPERQQKREVENTLAENREMMQKKREEQKKEEQKTESQLFIINQAKIKMNSHIGTFKVLNDVPTIQDKPVGTTVEKSPANFSLFLDGFQVLSVTGDWQDTGTAKYQDNNALIKKSTLMVTGKMPPPSAPIETGKIEFIDSGQINVIEKINTSGIPVPENENPDFDIKIKVIKDSFVPLGIVDFEGNQENKVIKFEMKISGKGVNRWHLQIKSNGNLIKDIYSSSQEIEPVPLIGKAKKTNKKEETEIVEIKRSWEAGIYLLDWNGFDNNNVYDSSILTSPYGLEISIMGQAEQVRKYHTDSVQMKYSQVNWVDVRIDQNNKRIDTTLRVNLKDGGAEGLSPQEQSNIYEPAYTQTIYPWDKIPREAIEKNKKEPIKDRTRSFEDLERLALEGISYHWGRNRNHAVAKNVEINSEKYEVFVNPINTQNKAMDDVSLIYNTNNDWMRSGNPGTVTGFISAVGNLFSREAVCYNVGYIKLPKEWVYQYEKHEDVEFKFTAAHEIGHEILKAFGDVYYSYGHKGSVNTVTQEIKNNAPEYPLTGEIDIMPYFKDNVLGGQKNQPNYYQRSVALESDVLGLLWLSKLKILLVVVLFTLVSCEPSYYDGYVYDRIENRPLSGVIITDTQGEIRIYSDSSGYFKFPKENSAALVFYKEPHYSDTIEAFYIQRGEKLVTRFKGETIFLLKKKDRDSILKSIK